MTRAVERRPHPLVVSATSGARMIAVMDAHTGSGDTETVLPGRRVQGKDMLSAGLPGVHAACTGACSRRM